MFSTGEHAPREAAGSERQPVLSTLPAGPGERNLALAVVLVSAALFAAVVPFAKIPLAHVPAFIATHQSALVTCDLITAVLLFSQFNFLRSRALLVLATGYLFTALITIAHALTYPDVYSPTGLLGAGTQTTAWLYFFWRGGFPLFVIVYALLKDEASPAIDAEGSGGLPLRGAVPVILAAAVAFALVCGLTLAATAGKDFLPVIMAGHLFSSRLTGIVAGFWSLSFLALAVLWYRRPHTVIDVWLMAVMCAWICDMGLGAVFNTGRFDLGFYAGRIYGLLAASFVLIVLLVENGLHYARLFEAQRSERRLTQDVLARQAELQSANRELESFSYSVSHDLRAPLRAIDGFSLMLEEDYAARLDEEGRRLLAVVRQEAGRMGQLIDDLLAFSQIGRKQIAKNPVDMAALAQEVVGELSAHYPAARIDIGRLPPGSGDRALLKQVWVNLVGNALKYSSRREAPRVEIGGHSEDTENIYWVKDNGAGFDMRYQEKLFRVFQRLHSEDEFTGTGVGLAIVQRVLARHHGRAWAVGEVDKGATFGIALPREESRHG